MKRNIEQQSGNRALTSETSGELSCLSGLYENNMITTFLIWLQADQHQVAAPGWVTCALSHSRIKYEQTCLLFSLSNCHETPSSIAQRWLCCLTIGVACLYLCVCVCKAVCDALFCRFHVHIFHFLSKGEAIELLVVWCSGVQLPPSPVHCLVLLCHADRGSQSSKSIQLHWLFASYST